MNQTDEYGQIFERIIANLLFCIDKTMFLSYSICRIYKKGGNFYV